ncbi:uncharacterized protein LOC132753978 [Ruditapes philippinarum]|uniref:uncharacterized protein LOC132753978 n=1 Tax=Ruditapes philippinarum TaxID=129788 RepID=UPI00295B4606|nr:uncharacterized protein LOC132753978 [Ruditapes philippinarum]
MGWIDGPDDVVNDKFPVDTLVKALKSTVGEIYTFCQDYHGQARKCCDGIRQCFATMETSFSSVKLQAIGNQDMHKACRKLKTDLQATRSCTVSWMGTCHDNVNAQRLAEPFNDILADQQVILDEHCNNLPPELPGEKTKPSKRPWTSKKPTDWTLEPERSTVIFTNSSTSSTTSVNNATSGFSKIRNETGSDNTIAIVSSAVGGLLLLCAIGLFMFILHKKRQSQNSDSGGSLEPVGKPSLFTWLFQSPRKKARSENNDTEIYAEIDEAFMEAVYRYDKEKPAIGRDRVSSNSQFNMCYESSFNEGAIISSRDTLESKTTTETSIVAMEPLSPLALIRKDDDAITSFQINQSLTSKLSTDKNDGKTVLSSQKSFLTRRPGFTDVRSDSSGDYVYIEAMPNDVFESENIYAVPSFEVSEYDTAEYGRNPERNIAPVPETFYDSFHVYTNVEQPSFQGNNPAIQQDVKEYRRSSSDLEIDPHLYENPDTLMEY